jgi:hypothetical protein
MLSRSAISSRSQFQLGRAPGCARRGSAMPASGSATVSPSPCATARRKPVTASGFASAKSVFTMIALP